MMSLFIKDVNELSNKRNKRKKKEMWIEEQVVILISYEYHVS